MEAKKLPHKSDLSIGLVRQLFFLSCADIDIFDFGGYSICKRGK